MDEKKPLTGKRRYIFATPIALYIIELLIKHDLCLDSGLCILGEVQRLLIEQEYAANKIKRPEGFDGL